MLYGLEAVYKYDQGRAYGHGNWLVQAEYLYEDLDLSTRFDEANPGAVGRDVNFKTDGAYLQGRYGFLPRWQVGLRYDVLGLTNEIDNGDGDDFGESDRWTAALTWSPSEFSRFRLQAERASIEQEDGDSEDFNVYYLQYILSLGSHGAHEF
jgi:phosphate-selective porin